MYTLICGHSRVAKNYVQHLFHSNIIGFQFVLNWLTNNMLIIISDVHTWIKWLIERIWIKCQKICKTIIFLLTKKCVKKYEMKFIIILIAKSITINFNLCLKHVAKKFFHFRISHDFFEKCFFNSMCISNSQVSKKH